MVHKLPSTHGCPISSTTQIRPPNPVTTNPQDDESIWAKISKHIAESMQRFSTRDPNTSQKLSSMKMKQQAQGPQDVPLERRFYLEVMYPMETSTPPKYFFFENTSRLGVVLDKVAAAGRVENKNNQAGSRKLQLISLKTGQPLPLNRQLKDCAEIVSGDSILLEYSQ
eukprot:TRINITY_DN2973_c0_g1_i1.p1 TRINITY_DN2973_c0_g1~~TRINITY_DN2973_c0_g1_i1.p1  ORF type:complete len:168 (-),score=33.25 TRINITY_DN2973_c0_g1_i1:206-709(-)